MQTNTARYNRALVEPPSGWPRKHSVFGVHVSATSYTEVVKTLIQAAKRQEHVIVDFTPVSVLVAAVDDVTFRSRLNSFDITCPDGQPVRWCLNHFYDAGLADRVCGTTAMLHVCEAAAGEGISIYLYGSTLETMGLLRFRLLSCFPGLRIAGTECPPFRPLSSEEQRETVDRIKRSGAGLVFLGIGSPRQENFAWEHRDDIAAVQLCVGAAFDFIAGTKRRAPEWIQRSGLEWLYRFCSEPVRLGKRYLSSNMRFLSLLIRQLLASNGPGI
jgi:N-acetylglucosaminyldiphosphoundecaprenol N-acetyl-beta-D-mannosaminyltransferase